MNEIGIMIDTNTLRIPDKSLEMVVPRPIRLKSYQLSQDWISEQNLINELKKANDILEKDKEKFEKELLAFTTGIDYDLVINRSFTHMDETTFDFNLENYDSVYRVSICIDRICDVISNPCLMINTKLSELDHTTLHELLNLDVDLVIGGQSISKFDLASNILVAKLCAKEVLETDTCTKIPLMILHNNDRDMIKLIALQYHEFRINISDIRKDILKKLGGSLKLAMTLYYWISDGHCHDSFDCFGKFIGGNYNDAKKVTHERRKAAQLQSESMIIASENFILSEKEISISTFTKFIIFRFIPKNSWNFDDLAILQPRITEVTIISRKNNISMTFSNILSMSVSGIELFVMPLTHETSNWNDMKDYVKECKFENTTYDFGKIRIKVITDIPYDNYNVVMTPVRFNVCVCLSGMMGLRYCG